jgi:hypothetical protein
MWDRTGFKYVGFDTGAVDVRVGNSGTLICKVENKLITVIATVGNGNQAYVTVWPPR